MLALSKKELPVRMQPRKIPEAETCISRAYGYENPLFLNIRITL